jgi:glycosyltransferase involved in cell wall biosynthesis
MVSSPLVSVVIASYNRAQFVEDAIRSVQNQTLDDIEIIVVDDGSTDSTHNILNNFGESINVINQLNQGRSSARNSGVNNSKGDYIAFLDSDDTWLYNKLDKQLDLLMKQPKVGLAHTFSDVVDESGNLIRKYTNQRNKLYHQSMKSGYSYENLSESCIMFLSTVMVRRDCWESVGPMDTDIPAFEDWDWYLRASRQFEISILPEVLVHFRLHSSNTRQEEFFHGRVLTCNKHLQWLDKHPDTDLNPNIRRNFYIQLASAYYVHGDTDKAGSYMHKAIQIDSKVLLNPSNIRYLLAMYMPASILNIFRFLKSWMFTSTNDGSTGP